jgi:hypothetical protein
VTSVCYNNIYFLRVPFYVFLEKKRRSLPPPPTRKEVKYMAKFFIKWWVDGAKLPDTPQKVMEHRVKMLEAVKAEMSAGMLAEWGAFCNGMEGYAITEVSEEDICATMLKYAPVIVYNLAPVLDADQSMKAVKKAAAAMRA